jgi:hypothetical protein
MMETQMEKQQRRKLIAILFLLSTTGAFHVSGESEGAKYEIPRKEISGYKTWLKVTPTPHRVALTMIEGIAD